jgi:SAM-dependent methyltransferase
MQIGSELDQRIQREYDRLLEYCSQHSKELPDYVLQQSRDYQGGLWKAYRDMLQQIPITISGKVVVDFGCKFGHLIPLLAGLDCLEPIGVDAEDLYVQAGKVIFPQLFPRARVLLSEEGYIPLQPCSVDLVVMNEVISHVNPAFLDTVWREVSRILKPGGVLYISDGNNRANEQVRSVLPDLYDKWENGPDGTQTDRDIVMDNFRDRRYKIIATRYPDLSADQVEYLAANTSGLFGDHLLRTIENYRHTGELILRPYQRGICPINPAASGVMMERAFHPVQLELVLAEYGFAAQQMKPSKPDNGFRPFSRTGVVGRVKDLVVFLRHRALALLRPRISEDPETYRSSEMGFQLIAVKE